jgi:predicted AAA+ superfamily ATPase
MKTKDIEMNYYRTISKSEIDFILKKDSNVIPAEVKFRKKVSVPVAVKNFLKNYNQDKAIIFTQNYLDKKQNIFFIPVVLIDSISEP